MAAQPASEGCSISIVKETLIDYNTKTSPRIEGPGNGYIPTPQIINTNSQNTSPPRPGAPNKDMGFVHHTSKLDNHDREGTNQVTVDFAMNPIDHGTTAANGSEHKRLFLNQNTDQANLGSQARCDIPMTKHMTLINESNLDLKYFQERQ